MNASITDDQDTTYYMSGSTPTGQLLNTGSFKDHAIAMLCPVPNDSILPLNVTSSLHGHVLGYKNAGTSSNTCALGFNGTSAVYIQACVVHSAGNGGACGASFAPGGPATFGYWQPGTLDKPGVDISAWSGGLNNDSYFFFVYVGCPYNGSDNAIWSYWVDDQV